MLGSFVRFGITIWTKYFNRSERYIINIYETLSMVSHNNTLFYFDLIKVFLVRCYVT